jgi:hypothetical protein
MEAAISDWTNAGISATQTRDLITLGENRIYRELRVRGMEESTTIAVSNGTIPVPADYAELKDAHVSNNPSQALIRVSLDQIYRKYPVRTAAGRPQFIARDGDNFVFGPYPGSGYSIVLNYYAKPATVVGSTLTGVILSNPGLLLFASLAEAEPYLGRDERIMVWEQKYMMIKKDVQRESDREDSSGQSLAVTPG